MNELALAFANFLSYVHFFQSLSFYFFILLEIQPVQRIFFCQFHLKKTFFFQNRFCAGQVLPVQESTLYMKLFLKNCCCIRTIPSPN